MDCENSFDDLVEKAVVFALKAHSGMKRKAGEQPYITHPFEVMCIASTMTDDPEVLAAALLHDVAEDTDHTLGEIYSLFGTKVGDLVKSETEDKMRQTDPSESWLTRKQRALEEFGRTDDISVKILWLSDKLSNMRSLRTAQFRLGGSLWDNFNQKDPKMHLWYHSRVAELTSGLSDTAAWQEYTDLIRKVFGGIDG